MSPVVPLRIDAAVVGKEAEFAEALAAKEQHWSGSAGLGGDIRPSNSLNEIMMEHGGEMCDRLMSEYGWSEPDFRIAAGRLEATGEPDLRELAQHVRAFELYAAEEAGKELSRDMNTMESFLREHGVPMVRPGSVLDSREDQGRRWPPDHSGKFHEPLSGPRTTAPLGYPVQTRPLDDREARGAQELPLSSRLLNAAREMAGLANIAKDTRQRNLISKYASRLRQMYARQLEREDASEIAPAGDDVNAEMDKLVNDVRAEANGAQPDDFRSFDDWADPDEPRQGSDDASTDDVDAQKRAAADDMALDEDLPRVPAPGRRVDEDDLGDASLHADDVPGRRKNTATHLALPKGNVYRGKPAGRYSAFKQSMRESGDLTVWLLGELDVAAKASHSHF